MARPQLSREWLTEVAFGGAGETALIFYVRRVISEVTGSGLRGTGDGADWVPALGWGRSSRGDDVKRVVVPIGRSCGIGISASCLNGGGRLAIRIFTDHGSDWVTGYGLQVLFTDQYHSNIGQ